MAVSPADGLHLRQSLAGDRHHDTHAMRWVMHRWQPTTPCGKSSFIKHELEQALMVVLRLCVEDGAEFPLMRPLSSRYDLGPVVAGLRHHVFHSRSRDCFQQQL